MEGESSFTIGICECGDIKSCLYSWCCTACALAESRTYLDGSPFCFNFCTLGLGPSLPAYRWLVRSSYKIGDNQACLGDVCCSLCCTCCVVNQLYQTTVAKGNPTPQSGGILYNTTPMGGERYGCCSMDFCCACLCPCCSVGTILNEAIGMPWCLGCCCVPFWQARNFTRYHLRLQRTSCTGDGFWCHGDCKEECVMPCCAHCVLNCIPYVGYLLFLYYQAGFIMGLKQDVALRPRTEVGYMVGYHPPHEQVHPGAPVIGTPVVAVPVKIN